MDVDVFALLLGFTLVKMAIAATILWLGFRSGERPPDDPGWGDLGPPRGPRPPGRGRARTPRRDARGGPARQARRRARV